MRLFFFASFLSIAFFACKGQKSFGDQLLTLQKTISLADVRGRIDHIDVNLKKQLLYVAALGNNSGEVVDLKSSNKIYSVPDLSEPQGIAFIPQTNEFMIANGGNGKCNFYNADNFQKTASVDLGSDADDVRYDSLTKRIYVGYGEGGIAVLDVVKHQKIADVRLPAHPEGFQIDRGLEKLFVNVPGSGQIDVIDLKSFLVTDKWKVNSQANFPMAIDERHQVIFIGCRHPNRLVAINATTGKTISENNLVQDVDDLFFDEKSNRIFASGGGGAVNIFSFEDLKLRQIANIPTRSGARTSLLVPSLNLFILAERAAYGNNAQLKIYGIVKD